MSKSLRLALGSLFLVPLFLDPGAALAQGQPEPEPEPEAEGDEVEMGDEGVADDDYTFGESNNSDLSGGDENPGDPNSAFNRQDEDKPKVKADAKPSGYPTRFIDRPVNLPGGMSEITFATPVAVDPFAASANLAANYGITREVQVGLRYGLGRYSSEPFPGNDDFAVGKAVAVDAQYLVVDGVSLQVSVPFYLDPFALGLVLGAPMRFTFFDSFSLFAGRDVVSIKLHEFFPSIDNATQNDALIAVRELEEITPDWIGRLAIGAIYQVDDKLAVDMEVGTEFDNEAGNAQTGLVNVGLTYATSSKFDLGSRISVRDLQNFTESLELSLFLRLRI